MVNILPMIATEILDSIIQGLDLGGLSSLRLVCRTLYQRTVYRFRETYFRKRRTDLSRVSLERLRSISQMDHLGQHVQHLFVRSRNFGRGFSWEHDYLKGSRNFSASGAHMLRDVLTEGLTNCRYFYIISSNDNHNAFEEDVLTASNVVAVFLTIIAESRMSVKYFGVQLLDNTTLRSFDPLQSARTPIAPHQMSAFRTAWASLRGLCLELTLGSSDISAILDLIVHAVNLRRLRLRFDLVETSKFLDRLLLSTHRLQGLEDFELRDCFADKSSFPNLLHCLESGLQVLSLDSIRLTGGLTWTDILTHLQKNFVSLQSLSIQDPMEIY